MMLGQEELQVGGAGPAERSGNAALLCANAVHHMGRWRGVLLRGARNRESPRKTAWSQVGSCQRRAGAELQDAAQWRSNGVLVPVC